MTESKRRHMTEVESRLTITCHMSPLDLSMTVGQDEIGSRLDPHTNDKTLVPNPKHSTGLYRDWTKAAMTGG